MTLFGELSPAGRLSRTGFWLRHLTSVPVVIWTVIAAGQSPGAPYDVPLAALTVAMLVSIWGRRLHDRGHSAWWLLGAFAPVIGAVALIVECGFRRAAREDNPFGSDPDMRTDYLSVAGSSDH